MTKDYSNQLSRYIQLRQVGKNLTSQLFKVLGKNTLEECGKRLGFIHDGVMVFENDTAMAILSDYCIFSYLQNGQNAVERYLPQAPFAPDSDEMILLKAMLEDHFSIFVVEEPVSGYGVHMLDVFCQKRGFITDVGFSHTAVEGVMLASRLIEPQGITMTTGASLPIPDKRTGEKIAEKLTRIMRNRQESFEAYPREVKSKIATEIIKTCLEGGALSRIRHIDVDQENEGESDWGHFISPGIPYRRTQPKITRNDPCTCGSGRKYKKCCGQ